MQRIVYIGNQRDVGHEFLRRKTPDFAHKALFADKAVAGCDNHIGFWKQDFGRDFQIHKTRMVHENEIRPVACLVHAALCVRKFDRVQIKTCRHAYQSAKQHAWFFGANVLRLFGGNRDFVGDLFRFYLHCILLL